eukprot:CAMPEP_0206004506 /NCGR_PEP_ID=MMETSP1464-20131121/4021_1 /ASSEMBLY_ACC=CAM_ASM_001124 /TAXON_ID=119497 /ORGANISM="Exanthemachrysis gayraliae, Strain RCC1523" /LENGTH=134 /DNA_ID=CAMNT_0053377921 /DNA_START=36 /DNA_END=440 /DNA_ORIENTATION=-
MTPTSASDPSLPNLRTAGKRQSPKVVVGRRREWRVVDAGRTVTQRPFQPVHGRSRVWKLRDPSAAGAHRAPGRSEGDVAAQTVSFAAHDVAPMRTRRKPASADGRLLHSAIRAQPGRDAKPARLGPLSSPEADE